MSSLRLVSNERHTFVFAGGGTGGHLIPAVALAKELQRLVTDCRIEFLIPGKELERKILDDHGMSFTCVGGRAPSGSPLKKLGAAFSLYKSYRQCKARLKELAPSAVFGVGGYGSVCGGMAAKALKQPLFLLEQNTLPGRVNRLMAKRARALYAQWPLEREVACPVRVTGNPIRQGLVESTRGEALARLGLSIDRRTLLVMGGSQGASALNSFLTDQLDVLRERSRWVQVIHLTGKDGFVEAQAKWRAAGVANVCLPYASDMGPVLAAADLVMCRAGATTIAELTALGKPMILVPLPWAAEDHQTLNARFVEKAGAAEVITQDKLDQPGVLEYVLDEVLLDDRQRAHLTLRSQSIGQPRAALNIARDVLYRIGLQGYSARAESVGESARMAA